MDKGTLDIMLAEQEGWSRAVRTLKWLHSRMRTPATLLLVSNSPPNERIDLLTTAFWHNIGFKVSSVRNQCFRGNRSVQAPSTPRPHIAHPRQRWSRALR